MHWTLFLPFVLGFAAVLQGGINRQIAVKWGLAGTVFLNNLMFLVGGLTLFLLGKYVPQVLPPVFRDKGSFTNFSWWYFLPGLFGFSLVAGLPFSISKIGALKVFLGLISAQMIGSMIWDAKVENIPITVSRLGGIFLAFLGAMLVARKP